VSGDDSKQFDQLRSQQWLKAIDCNTKIMMSSVLMLYCWMMTRRVRSSLFIVQYKRCR